MKNIRNITGLTILIFFVITGCTASNSGHDSKDNPVVHAQKTDAVPVLVYTVKLEQLAIKKEYTGSLEGEQQANIVSQLAERIIDIPVSTGSSVRAGQIVLRLDKSGLTSQYYPAQSNLKNIEKNLQRMKTLYESGAVSRQSVDEIQTGYDIALANFNAAKSAVDITSPIHGTVVEIKLSKGDFTAPGMPVMTVAKLDNLKMILSIGELDIPYVKQGQEITVYSEMNPVFTVSGKISEISKSADSQTRTFQVKAAFKNSPDLFFKPGMFVKAEIQLGTDGQVPVIPREAVVHEEEGAKVFVISGNKATVRNIRLGFQNDSFIEVTQGLNENDVIARMGMNNLKAGSDVVISEEKDLTTG